MTSQTMSIHYSGQSCSNSGNSRPQKIQYKSCKLAPSSHSQYATVKTVPGGAYFGSQKPLQKIQRSWHFKHH